MWKRDIRPQPSKISVHRWRLVAALVFLFSGALLFKLFSLQVREFDLYSALAAGQQQVANKLKPERGLIYFTETIGGQERLYPVATNKSFASLYAIPKDIIAPKELAERLYDYFDRPRLEEELRAAAARVVRASGTPLLDPLPVEIATSTREEIISGYLKRVDKPGDPYEPLENRLLDMDGLLKLYAWLGTSSPQSLAVSDLEIKNFQVMFKKDYPDEKLAGTVLQIPGLGFDIANRRYYPENEIGSHLLGFVSYVDGDGEGRYGLEEFFNDELFGQYGSLKSEKGGQSDVLIVNDREYVKPVKGADIVLTIDRNVQFFACQKLRESVSKHGASGGSVIALNPETGAVIAMCSVPDFNPNDYKGVKDISVYNNPALLYQYEPGSVFKTVTMSIAIDQGKVSPTTTYKDEGQIMIKGWPKPIKNSDFSSHGPHGVVDMSAVLDNSLNTGAIFVMTQVGPKIFSEYVKDYGFGEKTGIELGGESSGNIANLLVNKVKDIDAATASFGQGIAVTPLQMIMPYQAIANGGILMKPYIVKAIIRGDKREETQPQPVRQVISPKSAATVAAMLVNVVEKGHSKRAAISGYYLGGKTGTAQVAEDGVYSSDRYVHTFIGIAPIDKPAFVMLTKIDAPRDVQYAEGSAVPLWQEIADYMLKYYQVPKTR